MLNNTSSRSDKDTGLYAITGITGRVGGHVAESLLNAGQKVRAVARDDSKTALWRERGCEIAIAHMLDPLALTRAFEGVDGVFVLIPPNFDPTDGFPEVRSIIDALTVALQAAAPQKVVCLSTIGVQATQPNLLSQLGLVEAKLSNLEMPIAFLRAAWFMENSEWDVVPARENGVIPSFLQPLDRAVPMVATLDIGYHAARLLQETWHGVRVVELEGPERVTPNDIAEVFSRILGRPVRAKAVLRASWEQLFISQGAKNPAPRAQMLDGFNEGWIKFEFTSLKGTTNIETVLRELAKS